MIAATPGTPFILNGTLMRRANSRTISAAGPRASPVAGSATAWTALPAMKLPRKVPLGARSSATACGGSSSPANANPANATTVRCK